MLNTKNTTNATTAMLGGKKEVVPSQIWRVVEPPTTKKEHQYSPTNPFPHNVVILEKLDCSGEISMFRVAPVIYDIRYCGVQDAIFPREVFFNNEGAVALGCEFTLTTKELDRFEVIMTEEWFDKLAIFAEWMETEGKTAFPPGLTTGRPFTHIEDPGIKFHENLATNMQYLMTTVMDLQ